MLKNKIKVMIEKNEDGGCLITCTLLVKKQLYVSGCTKEEEADMVDTLKENIIKELRAGAV